MRNEEMGARAARRDPSLYTLGSPHVCSAWDCSARAGELRTHSTMARRCRRVDNGWKEGAHNVRRAYIVRRMATVARAALTAATDGGDCVGR